MIYSRIRQKQRASRLPNEIPDASFNSGHTDTRSSVSDRSADDDSFGMCSASDFNNIRSMREIQPIAPPILVPKIDKLPLAPLSVVQDKQEMWSVRNGENKPAPPPPLYADKSYEAGSEDRSPPSFLADDLSRSLVSGSI